MSTQLVCLKCPFFHPLGEPCPPGWHDVRSSVWLERHGPLIGLLLCAATAVFTVVGVVEVIRWLS